MSFRVSREAGLFRVDRSPVVFGFTEFWSRNPFIFPIKCFMQEFYAAGFAWRIEQFTYSLHLKLELFFSLIIRVMTGTNARNAHVEIQIKDLLLSVEFFTSFSLRPSRQSTHATTIVAESISDVTSHAGKPKNIYISMFWCFRKLPSEADVFLGEFWDSFTHHNSGNYSGQSINILTNQRLSPTFRGIQNTINVSDSQTSLSPIFFRGGGVCAQC